MVYFDAEGVGYFFPPPEPGSETETKAWRDFREYDEQNPDIWECFVEKTKDAARKGYKKIGAHFILHILRWETGVRAKGSPWKINHNHFPYYARKYMKEFPEDEGIFDIRKLTRK